MFIVSALDKQGPFHATKVRILLIMCNSFMVKTNASKTKKKTINTIITISIRAPLKTTNL